MPGIPELLVAYSHCIGETITIKQTCDDAVAAGTWNGFLSCDCLTCHLSATKKTVELNCWRHRCLEFGASKTFALLAFKGFIWPSTATDELVSGKFATCRSQARSWAQNPAWSKVFANGSVCLVLLLAEEASEVATRSGARLETDPEVTGRSEMQA